MTPEQLMEIPGIGEKMVDKIYQAVNRFYENSDAAAAAHTESPAETTEATEPASPADAEGAGETPTALAEPEPGAQTPAESKPDAEEPAAEATSAAAASAEAQAPVKQQEEKSS